MVTYNQLHARITDLEGTDAVDLVRPNPGFSHLISACRLIYRMDTDNGAGSPINLIIRSMVSPSVGGAFVVLPLPINEDRAVVDLMGYFSSLSSYGLSAPNFIDMYVDSPLSANCNLYTVGFSIVGADA